MRAKNIESAYFQANKRFLKMKFAEKILWNYNANSEIFSFCHLLFAKNKSLQITKANKTKSKLVRSKIAMRTITNFYFAQIY